VAMTARPRVAYVEAHGRIEARLGVVTIGVIAPAGVAAPNRASWGFCWATFLPGMPTAMQFARGEITAKRRIERRVAEWCEAANLKGDKS
jgi:hypothetical protein